MEGEDPAADPQVLRSHEDWVYSLAFSPQTRWLATASADGTARLWDLTVAQAAGKSVELGDHADDVSAVAFSPDGRWLATGSADGTARLWLVRLNELASLACQSAGRNFTQDEWGQFFPEENYRKTCEAWPEGR
jgi:WD40 repeat protein